MENKTLQWIGAAVGAIIVCFCIGYFFLGGKDTTLASATPGTGIPDSSASPGPLTVAPGRDLNMTVEETTERREEERRKKDEAARLAREKAEAEKARLAGLTATPEPVATPDVEATPEPSLIEATPTPEPTSATPEPTPEPTAKPTPKPAEPKPTPEPKTTSETVFRIRVGGSHNSRDEAEAKVAELRGSGFPAEIVAGTRDGKPVFYVQAGAFKDRKNAEAKQKELQANGYDATIRG